MLSILAAMLIIQNPAVGERTGPPQTPSSGLIPDDDQDPLIAAAAAFPLGSAENPVRVGGPEGEAFYLGRLRCADGSQPSIGSRTQGGAGAFGSVVASYRVTCAGAPPLTLVMDMYHEEHREERAPAGLTLQAR